MTFPELLQLRLQLFFSNMPRPVNPFTIGGSGLCLRATVADKLGLGVIPGASGLPGESCSSAKAQVSLQ